MLRIYLDTFVWIHLAKAAHGRPDGDEYVDALKMCRAARAHGIASFPIDLYRYWETAKNSNDGSRDRLADTIIELSDFDTISVPTAILDNEVDQALRARFGRPHAITPPRVFGRGIGHLTNGAVFNAMRPAQERPPSEDKSSDLRLPIDRELEETLLRAGPADHAHDGLPLDRFAENYVQHEVKIAHDLAALNAKGQLLEEAVVAADFKDIVGVLQARLDRAGISPDEAVAALGDAGLLQLVQDIPTRRVTNALRAGKHAQGQQQWRESDFVDVVALPVPTVYCDVVVTEKQWVDFMTRRKLGERFDTRLISDEKQLVKVLVEAAV